MSAERLAGLLEEKGASGLAARVRECVAGPLASAAPTDPGGQARWWIRVARAARAWDDLRGELDRPAGGVIAWPFPDELVGECDECLARLGARPDGILNYLSPTSSRDQALIHEAADVLARCREALRAAVEGAAELYDVPGKDAAVVEAANAVTEQFAGLAAEAKLLAEQDDAVLERMEAVPAEKIEAAVGEAQTNFGGQKRHLGRIVLATLCAESIARTATEDELKWLEEIGAGVLKPTGLHVKVVRPQTGRPDFKVSARNDGKGGLKRELGRGEATPVRDALDRVRSWLKGKGDDALADLCDQWEAMLGDDIPAAWWSDAKPEDRAVLWRIVQRLHLWSAEHPALSDFFAVLADDGFRLTAPSGAATGGGLWLIADAPGPATATGPALVGPDETSIEPAVWLRPRSASPERALLRCWERAEPLMAELRWAGLNGPTWSAANPGDDVATGLAALQACYDETDRRRAGGAVDNLVKLAVLFARCLRDDLGAALYPDLAEDGTPMLTSPRPPNSTLTPVASPAAPGSIVRVKRFGVAGSPAELEVSYGPTLPAWVAPWVKLSAPQSGPLNEWRKAIGKHLREPDAFSREACERLGKAAWQRHAVTAEGLADVARLSPDWLKTMKAEGWLVVDGQPESLAAALPLRATGVPEAEALVQGAARAALFGEPLDAVGLATALLPRVPGCPTVVAPLREWCRIHKLTLLPGTTRDGMDVRHELSDRDPGQVLRVEAYGLARGDDVLVRGRAVVSAGPAPEGYHDLERELGEDERARLHDLLTGDGRDPERRRSAVVGFFPEAWDGLPSDDARARLLDVLKNWAGVERHYPEANAPAGHDWEVEGGPGRRVKEVLRPGLVDADGKTVTVPRVVVG